MPKPKPLKVMSWNVNSVNARLDRLLALLKRHSPDVLCLQELKCPNEKFPEGLIRDMGYHIFVSGQKTYNGVAILSKAPPSESRTPPKVATLGAESRLIGVKLNDWWIYSVYVPNGQDIASLKYIYKLQWLKEFDSFLKTFHDETDKVLICGDFNVAQDSLDVYDPAAWEGKVLYSEKERQALHAIVAGRFVDTFRRHHPTDQLYSWWDYRALGFPLNHGLRIDLILASQPLISLCKESGIERDERKGEKPSDHAPVYAIFESD